MVWTLDVRSGARGCCLRVDTSGGCYPAYPGALFIERSIRWMCPEALHAPGRYPDKSFGRWELGPMPSTASTVAPGLAT